MRVTVLIHDERPQVSAHSYMSSERTKTETYVRVSIADAEANAATVGAMLRAVADDLAPSGVAR